jgi:hypothetical protein
MIKLMNSAMMPREGLYSCRAITPQEAKNLFQKNTKAGFKSHIGYPNTCRVLSKLFEVSVPLSRESTEIKQGDVIIAVRLPYRIDPDEKKGRKHGEALEDYEFFEVRFFGLESHTIVPREINNLNLSEIKEVVREIDEARKHLRLQVKDLEEDIARLKELLGD